MIFACQNGIWIQRPWASFLSYSAGTGSEGILRMVLRGEIERPRNFGVVNADPGMENSLTYPVVARAEEDCLKAGIPFLRTSRSLYDEFLALKASGAKRFDTPPLWTKDRETGKRGQLLQGCTQAYKIAGMYRAVREWMAATLQVPADRTDLGTDAIEMWIGFTSDEWHRIKEDKREYAGMRYPFVERQITREKLIGWYLRTGTPMPPRSVCNACFANDVAMLKDMHDNRPSDWFQAVQFDEAARDLRCIGVRDECYVSWTLIPLAQLAAMGFPEIDGEREAMKCHSGHCFT